MPTCPGCQQRVSYERLPAHLSHCRAVHGERAVDRDAVDQLERRVDSLEGCLRQQQRTLDRVLDVGYGGGAGDGDDVRTLRGEW